MRLQPHQQWALLRHCTPFGFFKMFKFGRCFAIALAVGFWWRAVATTPLPTWLLNVHGYLAMFHTVVEVLGAVGAIGLWFMFAEASKAYDAEARAGNQQSAAEKYGDVVKKLGTASIWAHISYFLGVAVDTSLFLGMLAAAWPVVGSLYGIAAAVERTACWGKAQAVRKWLSERTWMQIVAGEQFLLAPQERVPSDELPDGVPPDGYEQIAAAVDGYREQRRQIDNPGPTDPVRTDAEQRQLVAEAERHAARIFADADRLFAQADAMFDRADVRFTSRRPRRVTSPDRPAAPAPATPRPRDTRRQLDLDD